MIRDLGKNSAVLLLVTIVVAMVSAADGDFKLYLLEFIYTVYFFWDYVKFSWVELCFESITNT